MNEKTERELAAQNRHKMLVARALAEETGVHELTGREVNHAAGIRTDEASEAAMELWDNLLAADHEAAMKMVNATGGDLNRLYSMVSQIKHFPKTEVAE